MKTRGMKAQAHYATGKVIVNISKGQRTTSEKSVLNKDLDFAMIIKWISYLGLITLIEGAALKWAKIES